MLEPDRIRASIEVAAIVLSESKATFSAREFAKFLQMGAVSVHEEEAGEILAELVSSKLLREIGPGVYASAGKARA